MNNRKSEYEVWQRGPIDGVPALLQPVAHALLQAVEDVDREMSTFPEDLLWKRPAGVAPVGFHLKHLKGVIDRLFTYARGEMLNDTQLLYLNNEAVPVVTESPGLIVTNIRDQVANAIDQLKSTDINTLTQLRGIGRKQIPSTVIGLLFHAAEHAQRHVGQMIVTARILRSSI